MKLFQYLACWQEAGQELDRCQASVEVSNMLYENILNGILEKFIIINWIWYESLIFANLDSFSYLFFPMRIFMLTIFFGKTGKNPYFPTCQVKIIRFYVNYLLLLSSSPLLLLVVLLVVLLVILLVQLRPAIHSVLYRTSTTTIHAQCSLPDLNREYPRQVFPAGSHVGRYGTKNVQKKIRKNVRKNDRRYARRYAR